MKKKIILLLLLLPLLAGCKAKYKVEIKEGKALESLIVNNENISTWDNEIGDMTYRELIDIYDKNPPKVFDYLVYGGDEETDTSNYPTYNSTKISDNNNLGIKMSYNFDIADYKNSTIIDHYLTNLNIELSENNILTVESSNNWIIFNQYPNLEELEIEVDTDYKVISSNASKKKNGKLIWTINTENKKGKKVKLKLDLNKKEKSSSNLIIILLLVIVLSIIIFGYYLYNKAKQNKDDY